MTADADLDGASVVLVCDGTTWNTQGVKVQYDAADCDSGKGGTIRYNSGGTPEWEYCDGGADTWRPFEHAGSGESCFVAWEERQSDREWTGIATSDDGQNLVAVVYSGRPYTSTDGGVTWTQRDSANRAWQNVASSANGQNLVGVVDGGRPYTSTDAGVTWTQRDSANRNWIDVASSANGVNLVGVVAGGRPYTSTDSGATWTLRDSANRQWNAVASSADGTLLVAVVGQFDPAITGQIYTSTDSGATWTARAGAGTRWWSDVATSADGMTIAATVGTGEGGPGRIYVSTDGGATWNARASDQIWSRISMSADGTRMVAFVWGGSPWVSDDGGLTWEARGALQDWWASAMTPDGTQLFGAEVNGRIYTTNCTAPPNCADDMTGQCLLQSTRADGDPEYLAANIADGVNILGVTGTMASGGCYYTWTQRGSARAWADIASSTDGVNVVAVVFDGRVFTSTDSGATWTQRDSANRTWNAVASSADGVNLAGAAARLIDSTSSYIYTSTDSGVNWTQRTSAGLRLWKDIASSSNGTNLVAVVDSGRPYTSTDGGANWTQRDSTNRNWTAVTSSADGLKLAATVGGGNIRTSTDGGANWTARATSRQWVDIDSSADGTVLLASSTDVSYGDTLFISSDSGVTWANAFPTAPGVHWSYVAVSDDGETLMALSYHGAGYISYDGGTTWAGIGQPRAFSGAAISGDGTKFFAVSGDDNEALASEYIYTLTCD